MEFILEGQTQDTSESSPQPTAMDTSDSQPKPKFDKRKYLQQYHREHRKTGEPLSDQELEEWRNDWDRASERYPGHVPCFYCVPARAFEKLREHIESEHGKTSVDYRKDHHLNKSCPLASRNYRDRLRKIRGRDLKRLGRRTRFVKGMKNDSRSKDGVASRLSWGLSEQARKSLSVAQHGKPRHDLRKTDAAGRSIPDWPIVELRLRQKEYDQIAEILAERYGVAITRSSVVNRCRRIGLPKGKCALYDRGLPVTEERLIAHWEDMQFVDGGKKWAALAERSRKSEESRELTVQQAANLLGVSVAWVNDRIYRSKSPIPHFKSGKHVLFKATELLSWAVRLQHGKSTFRPRNDSIDKLAKRLRVSRHRVVEFVVQQDGPLNRREPRKHRRRNHPLSLDLAKRLVEFAEPALKEEWQKIGAGPEGGAPKVYLPSEERGIAREYDELMADVQLVLDWATVQGSRPTMATIGDFMCVQYGLQNLKSLLFWPKLHADVLSLCQQKWGGKQGHMPLSEQVKTWLIAEHGGSIQTIGRVISASRKVLAGHA